MNCCLSVFISNRCHYIALLLLIKWNRCSLFSMFEIEYRLKLYLLKWINIFGFQCSIASFWIAGWQGDFMQVNFDCGPFGKGLFFARVYELWISSVTQNWLFKYQIPRLRLEFLYQIKIGCECFIVLIKRPILWVHWRSYFKNKRCLSRENQCWSLCKSGQIFMRFTNID
jgi:hypothetical protein